MANTSVSLDKWREYFRSANSDIFGIIEYAIMVAASDCPYDFKTNRDRIAEMLFSCKMTKCLGCDRIELAVPSGGDGSEKSEDKYKSGVEAGGSKDTKESKVMNSSSRDDDDDDDDDDNGDHRDLMEMNVNQVGSFSFDDAEALTDEIEEESVFYLEVLRIKGIVDNYEDESDTMLFDSLRRLQLMPLSVETLKATEIGKSVNALRKHGSKDIRNLARTLIEDWKVMVDSWVDATAAIAASQMAMECVKTSALEEEEGLPSPPMDEGAFFTNPMELSQFFDGMDDDGNPQNSEAFNKNRETGRKPNLDKTDTRNRKIESRDDSRLPPKDKKVEEKKNPEVVLKRQSPPTKPNRPPTGESGPGRPKPPSNESGPGRPKPAIKPPVKDESKVQQRFNRGTIQRNPMPAHQAKLDVNNEASVKMKLEAAKRKLQERYQEAEKAKKQRTIQVVELRDLPKQGVAQRNQHMRGGNHNRNWANGRR